MTILFFLVDRHDLAEILLKVAFNTIIHLQPVSNAKAPFVQILTQRRQLQATLSPMGYLP